MRPIPSRKRLRPSTDVRSVLQPREYEVLASLAWAQILTTTQIERLHYPSRRVTQRRVRALLDAGLVRAHLQGETLHRDNLWLATAKGVAALVEAGRIEYGRRPSRLPPGPKLAHVLGVRDIWIAFLEAEREGVLTLDDFVFEGDLLGQPGFATYRLIPDGLATCGDASIYVEYDRGTETTRTLREKLAKWSGYLHAVRVPPTVLFVATGPGRVETLKRLLAEARLTDHIHAVVERDVGVWLRTRAYAPGVRAERTAPPSEAECFQPLADLDLAAFRAV